MALTNIVRFYHHFGLRWIYGTFWHCSSSICPRFSFMSMGLNSCKYTNQAKSLIMKKVSTEKERRCEACLELIRQLLLYRWNGATQGTVHSDTRLAGQAPMEVTGASQPYSLRGGLCFPSSKRAFESSQRGGIFATKAKAPDNPTLALHPSGGGVIFATETPGSYIQPIEPTFAVAKTVAAGKRYKVCTFCVRRASCRQACVV